MREKTEIVDFLRRRVPFTNSDLSLQQWDGLADAVIQMLAEPKNQILVCVCGAETEIILHKRAFINCWSCNREVRCAPETPEVNSLSQQKRVHAMSGNKEGFTPEPVVNPADQPMLDAMQFLREHHIGGQVSFVGCAGLMVAYLERQDKTQVVISLSQRLVRLYERLSSPTGWWDFNDRTCRFCSSRDFEEKDGRRGLLIHKPDCVITETTQLLASPVGQSIFVKPTDEEIETLLEPWREYHPRTFPLIVKAIKELYGK